MKTHQKQENGKKINNMHKPPHKKIRRNKINTNTRKNQINKPIYKYELESLLLYDSVLYSIQICIKKIYILRWEFKGPIPSCRLKCSSRLDFGILGFGSMYNNRLHVKQDESGC